jgi:hypothetical protein
VSKIGKQVADASFALLNRGKREVRKIIRGVAKDVIMGTPVDTGRLKNNWYASNRKIPTQSTLATDASGSNSMARVDAALTRLKLGQTFYMANNLKYSRVVEYGQYPNPPKNPTGKTVNGFSKQAPKGMLRKAVQKGIANLRRGN